MSAAQHVVVEGAPPRLRCTACGVMRCLVSEAQLEKERPKFEEEHSHSPPRSARDYFTLSLGTELAILDHAIAAEVLP